MANRKELKRPGRKRPKRGPSWRYIARASVLIVIFAVALIVFVKLLSLVPGSNTISPLVTLGLPLALSWLLAAVGGRNLVSAKQSLALATICLLVAAPLAYYKPWERGGGWQPGDGQMPDNIPEGYVAFRFVSSFTYVSSEGNQPITDVELQLPWPYINDSPRTGKPVGIDNYVYWGPDSIYIPPYPEAENARNYLWELFELENAENLTETDYRVYNWQINAYWPGLPYTEVSFEPILKLYFNDQLQWRDNQTIALLGGRTSAPQLGAYLPTPGPADKFTKVRIMLSDMRPGETVSIEGTFLVAEENANKVRLDDYIWCTKERLWNTPTQENAPMIQWRFSPDITIAERPLSKLEKFVGAEFVPVGEQQFGRITTVGYINSIGYGFLTPLQ